MTETAKKSPERPDEGPKKKPDADPSKAERREVERASVSARGDLESDVTADAADVSEEGAEGVPHEFKKKGLTLPEGIEEVTKDRGFLKNPLAFLKRKVLELGSWLADKLGLKKVFSMMTGSTHSFDVMPGAPLGKRAAAMAKKAVETGELNGAAHCWDWVNRVYEALGTPVGSVPQRYSSIEKPGVELDSKGRKLDYSLIREGSHVMFHNRNGADKYGNHSGIFLRWINAGQLIAEFASFPGAGKKARIHTVDLKKNPVARIRTPKA